MFVLRCVPLLMFSQLCYFVDHQNYSQNTQTQDQKSKSSLDNSASNLKSETVCMNGNAKETEKFCISLNGEISLSLHVGTEKDIRQLGSDGSLLNTANFEFLICSNELSFKQLF